MGNGTQQSKAKADAASFIEAANHEQSATAQVHGENSNTVSSATTTRKMVMSMTTRERLIAAGKIRPAVQRSSSGLTWTRADRTVRQMLIDRGIVRPAPEGMKMPQIMREFMVRCTGR